MKTLLKFIMLIPLLVLSSAADVRGDEVSYSNVASEVIRLVKFEKSISESLEKSYRGAIVEMHSRNKCITKPAARELLAGMLGIVKPRAVKAAQKGLMKHTTEGVLQHFVQVKHGNLEADPVTIRKAVKAIDAANDYMNKYLVATKQKVADEFQALFGQVMNRYANFDGSCK